MINDFLVWRLILPEFTDPYFNLALEETLFNEVLDNKSNFVLRFWKVNPCCVLGLHQYLPQEINEKYCKDNKIPIVRRITGGGAVYLDLGCLNYSLSFKNEGFFYLSDFIKSYSIILTQIIKALKSLFFDVSYCPPNSIFFKGKKISGNAQLRRGKFVLHHGTLLLNSNLDVLKESLDPKNFKEYKRAVKSKKVETTNLLIPGKNSISEKDLIFCIIKTFQKKFNISFKRDSITQKEIKIAKNLVTKKYSCKSWTHKF